MSVQYTSNYNLKKPEGTDVVNIDDLNDNADILDQKLKEVENKADSAPPNSVNDAAIGSRTPNQSQAPASPGTGTLTQLISWLANRIKAITGKTNWWDEPPTTLQAAKNHIDASAPHSGHETPSEAQAKADAALNSAKQYTDKEVGEVAQALTAHKAEMTQLIKIKKNVVILASGWIDDTVNNGFWIYEIEDADIDENTMVDVNIDLNDLEKASSVKSATDSFEGYVRLYADEQPIEDIIADIRLTRQVAVNEG